MGNKIFKNLDEQVEILKQKNLTINDVDYAKEVLLRENYFFLNGYRYPFIKSLDNKVYIDGVTFEELYSLFLFDRKLRNVVFKNILMIENNIKSIISYQLSKKYGYRERDYLNPNNFNYIPEKRRQVNDLLGKMKRQIKDNAVNHTATKHYINNYGYIPLWVLVKVLSFGIVSELFSILKKEDQYDIVELYDLDVNVFVNYLSSLSNYRNLCAHEDILFEHRTQKVIPDNIYHDNLNIPKINDEYIYGKGDLFSVVIIFKYLLSKDDFRLLMAELSYEIDALSGKLEVVSIDKVLAKMGFPINYKSLLDME